MRRILQVWLSGCTEKKGFPLQNTNLNTSKKELQQMQIRDHLTGTFGLIEGCLHSRSLGVVNE